MNIIALGPLKAWSPKVTLYLLFIRWVEVQLSLHEPDTLNYYIVTTIVLVCTYYEQFCLGLHQPIHVCKDKIHTSYTSENNLCKILRFKIFIADLIFWDIAGVNTLQK